MPLKDCRLAFHMAFAAIAFGLKRRTSGIMASGACRLSRFGGFVHPGFVVDGHFGLSEKLVVTGFTVAVGFFDVSRVIEGYVAGFRRKHDGIRSFLCHEHVKSDCRRKGENDKA